MEVSKVKLGSGGCGSVWLGRVTNSSDSTKQQVCAIKKTVRKPTTNTSLYSPSPSPSRGRSLGDTEVAAAGASSPPPVLDGALPVPPALTTEFTFRDESSEGAVLQTLGPNLPNIIPCPNPGPICFGDVEYLPLQLMDSDLAKEVFSLKNTVADLATLRHIMRSLLSALEATHDAGYAHRDVKPANLLVERMPVASAGDEGSNSSNNFHVYLSDFGSAHGLTDDVRRSSLELKLRGTCRYQAPEQVWQGPLRASSAASCDVWATGLCMFEVCAGEPLFKGERGVGILHSMFETLGTNYADFPKQTGTIKLRSVLAAAGVTSWWPEEAVQFLESCLQLEPQRRPSATQLLKHPFLLLAAAAGSPSDNKSSTTTTTTPTPSAASFSGWSIKAPLRNMEANLASTVFEDIAFVEQARQVVGGLNNSSNNSIHWSQQKGSANRYGCESSCARSTARVGGGGGGLFDSSSFLNSSTETVAGATGNGHRMTLGNMRTNDIFADMSTTRGKKGRDDEAHSTTGRSGLLDTTTSFNMHCDGGDVDEHEGGRPTVPFVLNDSGESTTNGGLHSPGLVRQGTQAFFDRATEVCKKEMSPEAHKQLFFDPATPQASPPRPGESGYCAEDLGSGLDTAILF